MYTSKQAKGAQEMNTIETLENQIATRTEINSPSVIWAYVVTK